MSRTWISALVGLGVLSLWSGSAAAMDPHADCDGAWVAGYVSRASFVEARAVLERRDGDVFVPYATTELSRSVSAGGFLLALPWGLIPELGEYRVLLESVVYDGLAEEAPARSTLEAWPVPQRRPAFGGVGAVQCGPGLPLVTSTAPDVASLEAPLTYSVTAVGGSGFLRLSMAAGPSEMLFDEATGALWWEPSLEAVGLQPVVIKAEDLETGMVDIQAFELVVSP